jgi:hypothetical protein
MTVKDLYTKFLVEQNKVQAPSLMLEDYNHFLNKAVFHYIDLIYKEFETTQTTTDNVQALKTGQTLLATDPTVGTGLFKNSIRFVLPESYYRLLSCIVNYTVQQKYLCYLPGTTWSKGCKKLNDDQYADLDNNAYLRPSYRNPYYQIYNANQNLVSTPIPVSAGDQLNPALNTGARRDANVQGYIDITAGNVAPAFTISSVTIRYLKYPMQYELTYDQRDGLSDTSQVMEFPDTVCYQILNIMSTFVLENASDARLQTFGAVNQPIIQS